MNRLARALVLGLVCWAGPVSAQSSDSKAAAEALFVEGRNLMVQENYAAACQKFEASQRLDPGLGTMLNLADCYEKSGRTASAWAQYREAIPAARAAGSDERASLAEERARALESRLSTLTIVVMGEATGVGIARDGVLVDRAVLSTPIPVDPGTHEVTASAPGHKTWTTKVQVGANKDSVTVNVPELEEAASTEPGQAGAPASSSWPAQKTWALVSGGVGVLGVGAGVILAVMASSELTQARDSCPTYPNGCSSDSRGHNDNARTFGDVATVGFIVGGVGLGVGTVLWITAPTPKGTEKLEAGIGPGSLTLRGTF